MEMVTGKTEQTITIADSQCKEGYQILKDSLVRNEF
jgi:hypothetical protein